VHYQEAHLGTRRTMAAARCSTGQLASRTGLCGDRLRRAISKEAKLSSAGRILACIAVAFVHGHGGKRSPWRVAQPSTGRQGARLVRLREGSSALNPSRATAFRFPRVVVYVEFLEIGAAVVVTSRPSPLRLRGPLSSYATPLDLPLDLCLMSALKSAIGKLVTAVVVD
jgi:hypothetical protein